METEQKMIQLLEDMKKSNRQQTICAKLQLVFSLIAAVCCIIALVSVLKVLPVIQRIATEAETVISNLETVTTELAESDLLSIVADMESLVENVDGLISTSQAGVEQTLQKINGIDFDALNTAIGDLSDVIEPIAKFFNRYKLG